MSEGTAVALWGAFAAYLTLGVVTLAALYLGGLKRFDPVAAAAPLRVKLIIAPGIIATWPVMAARLFGARPAEDRE